MQWRIGVVFLLLSIGEGLGAAIANEPLNKDVPNTLAPEQSPVVIEGDVGKPVLEKALEVEAAADNALDKDRRDKQPVSAPQEQTDTEGSNAKEDTQDQVDKELTDDLVVAVQDDRQEGRSKVIGIPTFQLVLTPNDDRPSTTRRPTAPPTYGPPHTSPPVHYLPYPVPVGPQPGPPTSPPTTPPTGPPTTPPGGPPMGPPSYYPPYYPYYPPPSPPQSPPYYYRPPFVMPGFGGYPPFPGYPYPGFPLIFNTTVVDRIQRQTRFGPQDVQTIKLEEPLSSRSLNAVPVAAAAPAAVVAAPVAFKVSRPMPLLGLFHFGLY